MRDLFSGFQKRGIACVYTLSLRPTSNQSNAAALLKRLEYVGREGGLSLTMKNEIDRAREGLKYGFFQVDILIFVWVDCTRKTLERAMASLEVNVDSVISSMASVFPEMQAVRLEGGELVKAFGNFFAPI
jgi:hypothetical protein